MGRAIPPAVRLIGARLAQGALVVLGAITVTFVLFNMIGSPSNVIGGLFLSHEQRAALDHRLGLDQPAGERYLHFLGGVVHGDLGRQYRTGEPAITPVMHALPNTMLLVACAIALGLAVALPIAVHSVLRRDAVLDRVLRAGMSVLQSLPEFWLGLILTLVFSVGLQALPSYGFNGLDSLILPTLALGLPLAPSLVRLVRAQLLDVMDQDFVVALRSQGLSQRHIVLRHGPRNILAPVASFFALQVGWLLGGSIIVEQVFAWPGIGSLAIDSVTVREFGIVQAIVIVIAVGYVLLNLAADLVALAADPRLQRPDSR